MTGSPSLRAGIAGTTEPGFEPVREAFEENFVRRGEVGAACAVYHRGRKVVDLWGGLRDAARRDPWRADTVAIVFSTTKGLAAMATAAAQSRGGFDLDRPVAAFWPEFAQAGKGGVTVRTLLAHRAGLSAVDHRMDPATLSDQDRLSAILARQAPAWEPGTRQGYHGLTLGWYQSELIRRTDPKGRTLGRFFREEIAEPLGLDFWFGLPPGFPEDRIAGMIAFRPWRLLLHLNTLPAPLVLALLRPGSLTARSLRNVRMRTPADAAGPEWRSVEFPSMVGFGDARSIARAYALVAAGGRGLGLSSGAFEAITGPAGPPPGGSDAVLKIDTRFSMGFTKPSPAFPFGSGPRAFGHNGAGGSFAYGDPDAEVGYAYVMNRMGFHLYDDPRETALRGALSACLERLRGGR